MFCKYCGKEIENEVNFCPHCGKQLNGEVQKATNQSKKALIWVAGIATVLVACLLIFVVFGDKDDSYKDTDKDSDEITWNESASDKSASDKSTPNNSSEKSLTDKLSNNSSANQKEYTKTSVLTKEKLTATLGSGTVVYQEESRLDEIVIAPDFKAWCEGEFKDYSVSSKTYLCYCNTCGKKPDLSFVQDYIDLLKNEYGFSVKQTKCQEPDWIGEFDYVWECTKDSATLEIQLDGLTEWTNGEYLQIFNPDGVLLVDTGDRAFGKKAESQLEKEDTAGIKKTVTVTPAYAPLGTKNAFFVTGWDGNEAGIGFVLSPDYQTGTRLSFRDFESESERQGSESDCYCEYTTTEGFYSTYETLIGHFEQVTVEILDVSDGYPVIYFYVVLHDDEYTRYYFEGVCAPKEGESPVYVTESGSSNSSGNSSDYSAGSSSNAGSYAGTQTTKQCYYCRNGKRDCFTCGGRGTVMCTLCHGTGTYRNYGQSSDCSCNNGQVDCPKCYDGTIKCPICGGDSIIGN